MTVGESSRLKSPPSPLITSTKRVPTGIANWTKMRLQMKITKLPRIYCVSSIDPGYIDTYKILASASSEVIPPMRSATSINDGYYIF
jgi:hypothetical protein